MIPNVNRGGNARGLLLYLLGPGRREEHTEQRLVAGSPEAMRLAGDRDLESSRVRDAGTLARFLDEPREVFGVKVQIAERDADGKVVGVRDAHVWHTSLSLHPDEEALSDERWGRLAERFIEEMGFAGGEAAAQCRWVAVRHGESVGGSDHIHLVVGLVAEDGSKASVHFERKRSQEASRVLEREFGLRRVEARDRGTGERGLKPGEVAADRRRGHDIGERGEHLERSSRQCLERVVRACAAASLTETAFVLRLREHGVRARARYADGGTEEVVGYSVRLSSPTTGSDDSVWYGGGRLSRELTLPRLRENWDKEAPAETVAAWRTGSEPRRRTTQAVSPELQQRCARELGELREQLLTVPVEDTATWAHTARETAAVFAAWSLRTEPTPGPLAETSRILARSAQHRRSDLEKRRWRAISPTRNTAAVLLAAHPDARAAVQIFRQVAGLSAAIADRHTAAGELARARELKQLAEHQLKSITAKLQAVDVREHAARNTSPRAIQDPISELHRDVER